MALTIFNNGPPGGRTTRIRLAVALHASETKAHLRDDPRRSPADARYLAQLARRFAADTGLPLALAQKRVQQLAISAATSPKANGR